jgi:large subunit ribosomal protein L32|tara:strand:+ start:159 stop:503 length:345 start_codon:yes stop_codon:yes gene_type:complete
MRHTKGHTGNRRSHHALEEPRLAKCTDCGEMHLKHRVCENCGKYRGRVVIDVEKEIQKKEEKAKKKQREMEQTGLKKDTKKGTDRTEEAPKKIGEAIENKDAPKPLNPQELSHN